MSDNAIQWGHFNPRSREGSDSLFCGELSSMIYFNPRSREGSDGCGMILSSYSKKFQSTLPRRERRINIMILGSNIRFQSTLPRRERQSRKGFHRDRRLISIHAPAKGATYMKLITTYTMKISIHAPAKGATSYLKEDNKMMKFQSTLPRRERQHLLTSFRLQYGYSLFHLTNKI